MMHKYKNLWYREQQPMYGPAVYQTDVTPEKYRGYLIYQRIHNQVWDVVKDGYCLSQRAGPNGARQYVDSLLENIY